MSIESLGSLSEDQELPDSRELSDRGGRGLPSADYGKLPEEGEPPHRFYAKALEALFRLGQFGEHLEGTNQNNLKAMITVLNHMLADDYNELLPEQATLLGEADELDYAEYHRALAAIEQYIQENKKVH